MNVQRDPPLVSVVTCFFNAERYLQAAIDSVLKQTYGHLEMLLIDDGSADSGRQIASDNAARDSRLRLLQHEGCKNLGKAASRNLGIAQAQGDYVVFLDADDVLLPEKLAHQVRLLDAYPEADAVVGRTLYWYSDSDPLARDRLSAIDWAPGTLFQPPEFFVRLLRKRGLVPCLCSPLIRLDLVRQLGGFDLSIPHLFEDQVLLAKLFLAGVTLTDDVCGEWYRQHPESSSAVAMQSGAYHPWRLSEAERRYGEWLAAYVAEKGYDDPALRRVLARQQLRYRYPRLFGGLRRLAQGTHWLRDALQSGDSQKPRRPGS